MLRTCLVFYGAIVAGALSASSAVAGRQTLVLQPSGKWEVDHGEYRCELRRVFAAPDGTPYLLSLPVEPFNHAVKLRLTRKEKPSRRQAGDARLAIDGSIGADPVPVQIFSNGDLRTRQNSVNLGRHPLTAAKSKVTLQGTGGEIEVTADQLPSAWRVVSSCLADLAADAGIDPTLMQAVATPPQGELLDFVTRPSRGGGVHFVVVYWVNTDGRVDDCRLVKPSGRTFFDNDICTQLKSRGRYKPAIGTDGKPKRAPRYDNIETWRSFFIFEGLPGSGHRVGDEKTPSEAQR